MSWLDDAKRATVEHCALALGYEFRGRAFGPTCPACKSGQRSGSDRRRPLALTGRGERWWHPYSSCDAHGDALDLVAYTLTGERLGACSQNDKDAVRAWFAAGGWCKPSRRPVTLHRLPRPVPKTPKAQRRQDYPPQGDIAALWTASTRLEELISAESYGTNDDIAYRFLESRGYDAELLGEQGIAKLLPLEYDWPKGFHWGGKGIWRLAVLAFDTKGVPRSIHARAVCESDRKTRWPYSYSATDLLFAEPLAHRMLMGEHVELETLIVCEGLTDFLSASQAAIRAGSDIAVIGAASGSFGSLSEVAVPRRTQVLVATDDDRHGQRYARNVRAALPFHNVLRINHG